MREELDIQWILSKLIVYKKELWLLRIVKYGHGLEVLLAKKKEIT